MVEGHWDKPVRNQENDSCCMDLTSKSSTQIQMSEMHVLVFAMTNSQKQNIVLYSFIGDALSLGPHWIYDQEEIASKAGEITGYLDPISEYHPGKKAGDFTHYGDQATVLLESIADLNRFDLEDFAQSWMEFWETEGKESYQDGATKTTLQNLKDGKPTKQCASNSHDLAGAARATPLFLLDWDSDDDLVAAVKEQTRFTHDHAEVIAAGEFFCRVALEVATGANIPGALKNAAARAWESLPKEWLALPQEGQVRNEDPLAAAKEVGLTCHVSHAFQVCCDLLLRYPDDPTLALITNARVGGDSAARGLVLGMIYGASPEPKPLPKAWMDELSVELSIEEGS